MKRHILAVMCLILTFFSVLADDEGDDGLGFPEVAQRRTVEVEITDAAANCLSESDIQSLTTLLANQTKVQDSKTGTCPSCEVLTTNAQSVSATIEQDLAQCKVAYCKCKDGDNTSSECTTLNEQVQSTHKAINAINACLEVCRLDPLPTINCSESS